MSLSSDLNKHIYVGNGVTKTFDYEFDILTEDDLHIYLTDTINGTETEITSNYSVSPSEGTFPSSNGTVTYPSIGTAISSDYQLTVIRTLEVLQPTVYPNNTALKPKVVERSFDRITMIAQQQQEQIDRTLQFAITVPDAFSRSLPAPVAGKALKINDTATAFEYTTDPAVAQVAAAESAAAAAISETNAASSATSSAASADSAETYANNMFSNIILFGAVNGSNSTSAIDQVITSGKPMLVTYGEYIYTGAQSTTVYYHGDGLITDSSGNPHNKFARKELTTNFVSHLRSYLGFVNSAYTGDNATRLYIMPKNNVTTGVGGALKIFGDPYHLSPTGYRDLGLYYHTNQNSDTGYNGTGVFWINVKTFGDYEDTSPDLGFSFQDGQVIAGRITRMKNENGDYAVWVIGTGAAEMAQIDGAIRQEIHGDVGLQNARYFKWENVSGSTFSRLGLDATDYFNINGKTGIKLAANDVLKMLLTTSSCRFDVAIATNSTLSAYSAETTIDVTTVNRVKFNNSVATTVSTISNGQNGQQLTMLFLNSNTTIQHNTAIKLSGGANFAGTSNDILRLEKFDDVWYEVSRSING